MRAEAICCADACTVHHCGSWGHGRDESVSAEPWNQMTGYQEVDYPPMYSLQLVLVSSDPLVHLPRGQLCQHQFIWIRRDLFAACEEGWWRLSVLLRSLEAGQVEVQTNLLHEWEQDVIATL